MEEGLAVSRVSGAAALSVGTSFGNFADSWAFPHVQAVSPMARLSPQQLDGILALQLTVAWLGESAGEPPRLGWWKSDLVDPEGGGDLFARLVPRTARWASLSLVREAARRVDEAARDKLGDADRIWSLFRFGFALDEQLDDRLAQHRTSLAEPEAVLGPHFLVGKLAGREAIASFLQSLGTPKVDIVPNGRRLRASALDPVEAARLLAAALLPLGPEYPLPHLEMAG